MGASLVRAGPSNTGWHGLLAYQVLEDERLVMTARLLWAPGSPTG